MRVVVLDPLPSFRRGIEAELVARGHHLLSIESDPSVAVVSIMAGDGAVLQEWIEAKIPVVAVCENLNEEAFTWAMRQGAAGIVARDADPSFIVDVVERAAEGLILLPIHIGRLLSWHRPGGDSTLDDALTPLELRWLDALAEGSTVHEVADEYFLSERVMYRRLQTLYQKLGVANRAQAIAQLGSLRLGSPHPLGRVEPSHATELRP